MDTELLNLLLPAGLLDYFDIEKINKNKVRCIVQDRLDKYKRYIGVCFVEAINLNQWMVRNGHAVAYRRYSKDYIKDEDYAKKNKLGFLAIEYTGHGKSSGKFITGNISTWTKETSLLIKSEQEVLLILMYIWWFSIKNTVFLFLHLS